MVNRVVSASEMRADPIVGRMLIRHDRGGSGDFLL